VGRPGVNTSQKQNKEQHYNKKKFDIDPFYIF
jgi:hypothetical protein